MKKETHTLLCVDDEDNILRSLKRVFRGEDFRVFTANNCDDAFELLANETIQVVMSDQRMPDMGGTEFLQQVKKQYPNTERVILSGYSEASAIVDAINCAEVYRFVGKPWDDEKLKAVVRECFARSNATSDCICGAS